MFNQHQQTGAGSYSICLSVAINNRLPQSFITNLLTKFIFNSAFLQCLLSRLCVFRSCLLFHRFIHCKFIDFPEHLLYHLYSVLLVLFALSSSRSIVTHLSEISSWWLRINRRFSSQTSVLLLCYRPLGMIMAAFSISETLSLSDFFMRFLVQFSPSSGKSLLVFTLSLR